MSANVGKNKNIKIGGTKPKNDQNDPNDSNKHKPEPRRSARVQALQALEEKKKTEVPTPSGVTKPPRKAKAKAKSEKYIGPQVLDAKYDILRIIEKHETEHTESRNNKKKIEHYIQHIKEIFNIEKQLLSQLLPQIIVFQYFIYQTSWDYIFKTLGSNAETLLNTPKYLENPYSTSFINNEGTL